MLGTNNSTFHLAEYEIGELDMRVVHYKAVIPYITIRPLCSL